MASLPAEVPPPSSSTIWIPPNDSCNGLHNVVLQQVGSTDPSLNTIISASAFGGFATAAPGTWIEIYGTDLASDTRSWGGSDFHEVNAPTALDGTSVSVGGQSAFSRSR